MRIISLNKKNSVICANCKLVKIIILTFIQFKVSSKLSNQCNGPKTQLNYITGQYIQQLQLH